MFVAIYIQSSQDALVLLIIIDKKSRVPIITLSFILMVSKGGMYVIGVIKINVVY
jgi:hypothetical protein